MVFFMMPQLTPIVTLFVPSEPAMKDIMKLVERTLEIDEVIVKKQFFQLVFFNFDQ